MKKMIKVLLVEDERLLLKKMRDNIEWRKYNYKVLTANNGLKGYELAKKYNPEILVTDIKMPDITGIELIKKVNGLDYSFIPIIISGYAEFEYARESIHLNVEEYILKPFQSFRLLEVVKRARAKIEKKKLKKDEIKQLKRKINSNYKKKDDIFLDDFYDQNSNLKDIYDEHNFILLYEDIFKTVKTGMEDEIISKVEEIFKGFKKKELELNNIIIIVQNMILLIFKSIKDYGYNLDELLKNIDIGSYENNSIEAINDWFIDLLLEINKYMTNNKLKNNKNLITKVNKIIKEKYNEGITLSSIADKFNVSSSYLSKLFYEKNEVKFSKYIDGLRLEKSKELLKITDYKIYEVAKEIGFEDPYYFSSWFKKQVGLSPSKYRKNINMIED
ncbi:MAG: response regulator [Halanaerobiales bacterium]|nr:response regulator [Halanaerobiales bacterium]